MLKLGMCVAWIALLPNLALALAPTPAPFEMEPPVLGGAGCGGGTASTTVMQYDHSIKLGFTSYIVEAGGTATSLVRKNCSISVPLKVSSGYSVAVPVVELQGFNTLADGAVASFDIESFFTGQQGPHFKKEFHHSGSYAIRTDENGEITQWSPCGQSVNMRVNISVVVKNNTSMPASITAVENGLILPLKWKKC